MYDKKNSEYFMVHIGSVSPNIRSEMRKNWNINMSESTRRTIRGAIMGSVSTSRVGSLFLWFGCIHMSVGMASRLERLMGFRVRRVDVWSEEFLSFFDL